MRCLLRRFLVFFSQAPFDAGLMTMRSFDRPGRSAAYGTRGMAATSAVLGLFPGARVLAMNDVYGGTYRLFSKVLEPQGYRFAYADLSDIAAVDEALEGGHVDQTESGRGFTGVPTGAGMSQSSGQCASRHLGPRKTRLRASRLVVRRQQPRMRYGGKGRRPADLYRNVCAPRRERGRYNFPIEPLSRRRPRSLPCRHRRGRNGGRSHGSAHGG